MAKEPRGGEFYRGVASVPPHRRPATGDTDDLPVTPVPDTLPPTLPDGPAPVRLPREARRRTEPPRGMVVRQRWRRLRSGAGWTWSGALFLFVCWGIWAVSVRGTDFAAPTIGLVLVLAFGAFMFVVARLLGRAVLEQALGRERLSAWPSHLTVCVFFVLAGITFLQQTQWIKDSWQWVGDSWQWLADAWGWVADAWGWVTGLWPW